LSSDQRRFPRKTIQVQIRVNGSPAFGQLVFDSADLSLGGAFLQSEVLYDEGEPLELELRLPWTDGIRARARIAWVRRIDPDGAAGMGVQFDDLDPGDRQRLERFLARLP
jgi:uncharacterized protein (TIGR02266 family)